MKRRFVGLGIVILVFALVVAGCGGGKAKSGGELSFYNWTEYMPQEILDQFTQETGIQIIYDMYSSNEDLYAKMQAGGTSYDLIVPSDYMVQIMVAEDMLAPLDKANIPNFKYVGEAYQNQPFDPGNVYSVPYMWGTTALVYNTEFVPEPADSWAILWDPKYKGKVILNDDSRGVVGLGLNVLGYSLNETDPARLEQAKQKLLELVPSVVAFDSDSPKSKLLAGEAWLGQVWNGEAALLMQEDPKFKYVIPKEGASIWMDNMAIPKGARNKQNAEAFINFLLRPEVSKRLGEEFPYGLPNPEAIKLLAPEVRNNTASYPPEEWLSRTEWIEDVGDATELFDRIYTEVKGE